MSWTASLAVSILPVVTGRGRSPDRPSPHDPQFRSELTMRSMLSSRSMLAAVVLSAAALGPAAAQQAAAAAPARPAVSPAVGDLAAARREVAIYRFAAPRTAGMP